jgi:hypothetical protein
VPKLKESDDKQGRKNVKKMKINIFEYSEGFHKFFYKKKSNHLSSLFATILVHLFLLDSKKLLVVTGNIDSKFVQLFFLIFLFLAICCFIKIIVLQAAHPSFPSLLPLLIVLH